MIHLYDDVSYRISKIVTNTYSTSFSSAVSFFDRESRMAIYSIYGFVRLADEIVDTFHEFNKVALLEEFESDYYKAFNEGISLNPVLHSFQITVKKYNIQDDLIQAFLGSMKKDLVKNGRYSRREMDEYIYGSAEVVGLMCLNVFVRGDRELYEKLKFPAMKLGAAFQKVNFLRDLKNDVQKLNRSYFPDFEPSAFCDKVKEDIIGEIDADFREALNGIRELPNNSKLPVFIAYHYYGSLLRKIRRTPAKTLLVRRIRIPAPVKIRLFIKAWFYVRLQVV